MMVKGKLRVICKSAWRLEAIYGIRSAHDAVSPKRSTRAKLDSASSRTR